MNVLLIRNKFVLILISLISCNFISHGQINFFAYQKFNYQWTDSKPAAIPVNAAFANEDVVYTDDQHVFSIVGSLGSVTSIIIQRKARIKFLTQKGIDEKSTIILPESLDPLYDDHNLPFTNNKIKKGPSYFDLALNWFAARIIRPDGSVVKAEYNEEFKEQDVLNLIIKQSVSYKYVKSHYWNFAIKNLQPGDEVEYDYQIMFPFDENFIYVNSGRIFFHGEVPCQNYSLLLKYKIGPTHSLNFANNAEPDSTAIIDKVKFHYWTKTNLHGCLDELGSRPYETLPHIIYSLNTQSGLFKYNDELTAKIKYSPYWVVILGVRESFDYTIRKNAQNNVKDKQNLLVDAFIKSKTEGIPDSLAYYKYTKVIETIADSFKYFNDEALFREEENRGERMGEFTAERKIREISRHKLYAKILNEVKLNYMTLYLMDKRYGKINNDYQSPIWNTECLYAALTNGTFAFAHPKKSDFGWYVEELPFYWENTTGLLVNYDDLFYILADKPKILGTPQSSLNDNIRMSNIMAEVDLDKKTTSFSSKVSLSGQYSTITRMLYTLGINDSINNSFYNKKIYDINNPVKEVTTEISAKNTSFPFKFDIKCSYKSDSVVTVNTDGSFNVDMNGWFNHIIYENLIAKDRQLDFYPD
ncbi:MAG TPA: hypothetical protein PKD91_12985, partial [Bacteroidia bacterium]|nr:hypothetical protein [Bacteroidia bacterium]